jgi:hypothetical protein
VNATAADPIAGLAGAEAPTDPAWFNAVRIDICEGGFENAQRIPVGA